MDELILWLDCDREGEAIAFDVIEQCLRINPKLDIKRAHFSALTREDITHAIQNLTKPNRNMAQAVNLR
jgi:DNA topoisomerase-3